MDEISAQVEDALTDNRVPRYVKQLIQDLYAQLTATPWGATDPAPTPGMSMFKPIAPPLTRALGQRRPNLSTLPSIPMRRHGFVFESPQTRPVAPGAQAAGLILGASAQSRGAPSARQLPLSGEGELASLHSCQLNREPPLHTSPGGSPAPSMIQPPKPVPHELMAGAQSASGKLDGGLLGMQTLEAPASLKPKRPTRDVVFTLVIDAVGTGTFREVDVVTISPSDHRVLLASRIINFNEIQELRKLADQNGYQDMSKMPFGQKVSGDGCFSYLPLDCDVTLGRVCRRLAAIAQSDYSRLQHAFVAKFTLGSKIRWHSLPMTDVSKVVYVFLNEGQDGVLSIPDVGVKIRAQKGTAICMTDAIKGLEKTTGGVFPDGYKQVLIAVF